MPQGLIVWLGRRDFFVAVEYKFPHRDVWDRASGGPSGQGETAGRAEGRVFRRRGWEC